MIYNWQTSPLLPLVLDVYKRQEQYGALCIEKLYISKSEKSKYFLKNTTVAQKSDPCVCSHKHVDPHRQCNA